MLFIVIIKMDPTSTDEERLATMMITHLYSEYQSCVEKEKKLKTAAFLYLELLFAKGLASEETRKTALEKLVLTDVQRYAIENLTKENAPGFVMRLMNE